jgi:hypothetical protein
MGMVSYIAVRVPLIKITQGNLYQLAKGNFNEI